MALSMTEILALMDQGKSLDEIGRSLLPERQRELLRRCALPRTFDRALVDQVLRLHPPEVSESEASFEQLIGQATAVLEVPGQPGVYSLSSSARGEYLKDWTGPSGGGVDDPSTLARKLLEYYEDHAVDPLDVLYVLPRVDPERAVERFRKLYKKADDNFDLARCNDLVRLFDDYRRLPQALADARNEQEAYLRARGLWVDEYYRTACYSERTGLSWELEALLKDDQVWILHTYAPGGLGKTMFLRWAISRSLSPRRIPIARLDFDFQQVDPLVRESWRLIRELARQLNPQIPGAPLGELLGRLDQEATARDRAESTTLSRIDDAGDEAGDLSDVAEHFTAILREALPDDIRVVLILDTLEEVLIPNPGALDALLEQILSWHQSCPSLRLILSGRYNLRQRLPGFSRRVRGQARSFPVQRMTPQESRKLLLARGIPPGPTLEKIIAASRGTPLKLALYSEIVRENPKIGPEEIVQARDIELEYLIRRIVNRIKDHPVRWVLRYGAVPRLLTFPFLAEVMATHLVQGISGRAEDDDPAAGLPEALRKDEPFPVGVAVPLDWEDLWNRLVRHAGNSSWVRLEHGPDRHGTLLFHNDVLNPMRKLLQGQEVFSKLHNGAIAFYRAKADAEPGRRADWLREATYHDFQLNGAAAGERWRESVETAAASGRHEECLLLAREVLDTAYVDDKRQPLRRRDDSPMIDLADLIRARYRVARSSVELARRAPAAEARKYWQGAGDQLNLLDKTPRSLLMTLVSAAELALVEARVLASRHQADAALKLLDQTLANLGPDATDESSELLLARSEILDALGRSGTQESYAAFLELRAPVLGDPERARIEERLVRTSLDFDRISEAEIRCRAFLENHRAPEAAEAFDRMALTYREVLLHAGWPEAAARNSVVLRGGLTTDRGKSTEIRMIEGLLLCRTWVDQLQPLQALAHLETLRKGAPPSPKPPTEFGARYGPQGAAVIEANGQIMAELMEISWALNDLDNARTVWARIGDATARNRCLAGAVRIQLRIVGNFHQAESLLKQRRTGSLRRTGLLPEDEVELELLHAELLDRLGDGAEAQETVDKLLGEIRNDRPPRVLARIAVAGLARRDRPTPKLYVRALVRSLASVEPPTARGPLLDGLSRCSRHDDLPDGLPDAIAELVPGAHMLGTSDLLTRDRGLLALRAADAYRVIGRTEEAVELLGLSGASLLDAGESSFPLRQLLLAEDRIGVGSVVERGDAPDRFLNEFHNRPGLSGSFLLEEARRQHVVEGPLALESLLNRSQEALDRANLPSPNRWTSDLYELRTLLANSLKEGQAAEQLRESAIRVRSELGEHEPSILLSPNAEAMGDLRLPYSSPSPLAHAEDRPTLSPNLKAYDIRIRREPSGTLSVQTRPPGPGKQSRVRKVEAEFFRRNPVNSAGLEEASLNDLAKGFLDAGWASFSEDLATSIFDSELIAECGQRGQEAGPPPDLCLNLNSRLEHLPWESLKAPGGDGRAVRDLLGIRFFYRTPEQPRSTSLPVQWLKAALNELVDARLAVDGLDGPGLREAIQRFQRESGMEPTGWGDPQTLAAIDSRLSDRRDITRHRALIFQVDEASQKIAVRGLAAFGNDLGSLYFDHRLDYAVHADFLALTLLSPNRQPPSLIHISAGLKYAPSLGPYFDLSGPSFEAIGQSENTITISMLDRLLQSVPETAPRPLVILDPPRPYSTIEALQQLFLRNVFASELYRLGNVAAVLATGLFPPEQMEGATDALLGALSQGNSLGQLIGTIEAKIGTRHDSKSVNGILTGATTALWAKDAGSYPLMSGAVLSAKPDPDDGRGGDYGR